jgi:hypothetical protein
MLQPMYISQQSTLHSPAFCLISDNPSPTTALAAAAATTQLQSLPSSILSLAITWRTTRGRARAGAGAGRQPAGSHEEARTLVVSAQLFCGSALLSIRFFNCLIPQSLRFSQFLNLSSVPMLLTARCSILFLFHGGLVVRCLYYSFGKHVRIDFFKYLLFL